MKKSEVRIVPVAADCDRRRADPKNPTERMSAAATSRWSNLATDLSTESTKSIKPRPNQAQSSPIKPNRAISCLDALQSRPPAPATSSTPSMPTTNVHQIRNPQFQSNPDKASQSRSKCFGTVFVAPRSQPPSLHIVVSPTQHTANCTSLLRHTAIEPCQSRFPSNPVKAGQTNPRSEKAVVNERISELTSENHSLIHILPDSSLASGSLTPASLAAPANPQSPLEVTLGRTQSHHFILCLLAFSLSIQFHPIPPNST
jgi:hypothetical protein